jgi:3',5'-cyclic AMP phosphodiesterase CpdA
VAEAAALRPRGLLINGDLAREVGNPGDYATFFKLLKPCEEQGLPVHLTLGNHDDRKQAISAMQAKSNPGTAAVNGKWASMVDVDGCRWFFLDSLEKTNVTQGSLGVEQLDWLDKKIRATAEGPVILCLHHNPERTDIALKDTAALLKLIVPLPQVKAVFFGHTHTYRRWEISGIHLINLPAVGYNFNDQEPVGWVKAAFHAEGMELELRSLNPGHPAHGKCEDLKWRSGAPRRLGSF